MLLDEAKACIRYAEGKLFGMPKDVATAWYDLRDLVGSIDGTGNEAVLGRIAETMERYVDHARHYEAAMGKDRREYLERVLDRWRKRALETENAPSMKF